MHTYAYIDEVRENFSLGIPQKGGGVYPKKGEWHQVFSKNCIKGIYTDNSLVGQ